MSKQPENSTSRREFVKGAATVAAGVMIVPRHVLGGPGYTAPSDKLNIASIGAGGKGHSDILRAWNDGKENVVALCDIDREHAKRSDELWPKATWYSDFRVMLDKQKDIDAVTISTPDHTHTVAAMAAMQMGKHVYVQKPLTHNIKEARMLTEAARKHKIVTQMGNQGASNPGMDQMKAWYKEGQGVIGEVSQVHVWTDRPVWPQGIPLPTNKPALPSQISAANWDLFIGPAKFMDYDPLFHPFKWRGWWNFGTGALGDMGCHLIDPAFRVLGLGYPSEVECSVGQIFLQDWVPEYIPEGCPPSSQVQLKFPSQQANVKEITMNWSDGGIRPFHPDLLPTDVPIKENGVIMIGSKGIMTCDTYGINPKVYLNGGDVLTMEEDFYALNPHQRDKEWGHEIFWTEAVKAGFGSKEHKDLSSSFDYAGPLTETVLMGNLAIRSYQYGNLLTPGENGRERREYPGRMKLLWDGEDMKVTNYEAANQFVGREYRKGWEI
jgi:predicted dehydrogenase